LRSVDQEAPARAERPRHGVEDALVLPVLLEVSERGVDAVRGVELAVEVDLSHVRPDEGDVQALRIGGSAGELERARAEIDAGDV